MTAQHEHNHEHTHEHAHEHAHTHTHTHQHGLGGHHHHQANESEKNLWIAFGLNITFALIEIIGGLWTGSTAILSDALHDFGDSFALGLSAFIQRQTKKHAGPKYNYGWKRLPIIGAILNIFILTLSTAYIIQAALPKLFNATSVDSQGMLIIAVFGVIANGLAVFRMKGAKRILDRTVVMHLLEDLLGWIAVLIVAIVMYFTNWFWLDPLLSLVISGIMVKNIFSNTRIVIDLILGATLDVTYKETLATAIVALDPRIETLAKFQLWSLDGEEQVACLQVVLTTPDEHEAVIRKIRAYLETEAIHESTIECCYATE